jgi:serine/threonine-protein kinase
MSNDAHLSLIGRTLGNRYAVERVVGTGAMGTVYCARQLDLGSAVAVKVLHPRLMGEPGLVERFEREAFATSRIDHPNALRVLDFGQDGDLLYLVTEYVDAEDLLAIMEAEWPLSDERIVRIVSQVLSALSAVHEVGIVHRDVKPENILVVAGQNDDGGKADIVKVCDFGIAKVARPSLPKSRRFAPRLTAEGLIVGTPDYMSPEQARGQAVDGRSDLYSVGVVLYHLLAGRTPFDADTPVGIALQHVSEAPNPPSHHRNVHPGLEAVCMRALRKQPQDRFQTAREMRKALRDALTTGVPESAMVPVAETPLRVRSNFTSSGPAVLSLRPVREALARTRFGARALRRKRFSIGYAVAASVATMTASAFVASTRGSAPDPIERPYNVRTAMALIPPTDVGVASRGAVSPADTIEADPVMPTVDVAPASPSTIEPIKRPAPVRSPASPAQAGRKPPPRSLVVAVAPPATPIPSVSPPASSVLLIRRDPWPTAAEVRAPESPPNGATRTTAPERREPVEARNAPLPATETAPSAPSNPSRASVHFANVTTSAGISGAKVKVTLAHVPLLACYQQALRSRPADRAIDAELRLTIDVGGRVVNAALSRDGSLAGLRSCVESAVRGAQVRDVDTGDGFANVQLRFSPR